MPSLTRASFAAVASSPVPAFETSLFLGGIVRWDVRTTIVVVIKRFVEGRAGRQFCTSAENEGGEGRTRRVRRARAESN
jgi:hypothetical protein